MTKATFKPSKIVSKAAKRGKAGASAGVSKIASTVKDGGTLTGWMGTDEYNKQAHTLDGQIRFQQIQVKKQILRYETANHQGHSHRADAREIWAETQAIKKDTAHNKLATAQNRRQLSLIEYQATTVQVKQAENKWKAKLGVKEIKIG